MVDQVPSPPLKSSLNTVCVGMFVALPVRSTVLPTQTVLDELLAETAVGPALTTTVTVVSPEVVQPVFNPVTVYVVVVVGFAVTIAPEVALRPVLGDHVYPFEAPEAVRTALPPVQKDGELGDTETVGPTQGV